MPTHPTYQLYMVHLMVTLLLLQVMLWDTAGAEQFRTLSDHYYREACGGLLVYCVEDTYTFESLQEWIDDANRRIKSDKFVWALLGNKSDLYNEIGEERVEAQCQLMNTDLSYQCSAKTGENVMEAFNAVVVAIHKSQSAIKLQQSTTSGDTIEFDEPQGGSNNSHKCSC